MSLLTPAHLSPERWYDGSDASTRTIDTGISVLGDKSVNAEAATQSVGASQPTVAAASLNGLDTISCANQWFEIPDLSHLTEASIFLLVKVDADPPIEARSGLWKFGNDPTTKNTHYPYTDSNVYEEFGSTVRKNTGNPTPSLADWRLYCVEAKDGLWRSSFDDVDFFITSSNTLGWSTTHYLGRSLEEYYLWGKWAECVILGRIPTVDDRSALVASLLWKYGLQGNLAAGHPYESAAPTTTGGGIVMPPMLISGVAVNPIVAIGNVVAQPMTISGKVWNVGLGDVVAPKMLITGEALNAVVGKGGVSMLPKVSGVAYNPVGSVGNVTMNVPKISGLAVNTKIASGNISAKSRAWGVADNPKALEIIRFRRWVQ